MQVAPNHEHLLFELFQTGFAHHQKGSLAQAEDVYRQILKIRPSDFDTLHLMGVICYQSQRYQEALIFIDQAIEVNATLATAFNNRGLVFQALNNNHAAIINFDKAIALDPASAQAFMNRANALQDLMLFEQAVLNYQDAIRLSPEYPEAFYNLGNTFRKMNRFTQALESYDRALAIRPDYAEVFCNRGTVLFELKKYQSSLENFVLAISHNREYSDAYSNLGVVQLELGHFESALESFAKAILLSPEAANNYLKQGHAFKKMKRFFSALESYDKAISFGASEAELFLNRGIVLKELGRLNEALISFDKASLFGSDHFEIEYCRGAVLKELNRFDEALVCYNKAVSFRPNYDYLLGIRIHIKMLACDWTDFHENLAVLKSGIAANERMILPFPLLALSDSLAIQHDVAKHWIANQAPARDDLGPIPKHSTDKKIRLGYYSADFHQHATAYLMADFFECHDKNKFELIAFSFGVNSMDQMRVRVAASFDQFIDVTNLSDLEIARLSRDLKIDIAIDLKGFTGSCRTNIFSYRAAPVQVSYLGYPGTMGAPYIDYIIADNVLIPQESRAYYSEKIAYLPDCYQVNDRHRLISSETFSRAELGLPETGFVYCCFNNSFKITPEVFEGWMRILQQVEHSVLWLLTESADLICRLREQAEISGVSGERLVFGKRLSHASHLSRHRQADLFLDTFPCNAHTTASDSLWSGLPLITLKGESFAARVAASLLQAVGLPELITSTQEDYETLAVRLGTRPDLLVGYRNKLNELGHSSPLFNTPQVTQCIESIYIKMYSRYLNDLQPDHIFSSV